VRTAAYIYAQHNPKERLVVEVIDGIESDAWIKVGEPDDSEGDFTLGLSVDQARDLARELFKAAAGAEAAKAEADAKLPQAAPA
jgi:hypothetical protein